MQISRIVKEDAYELSCLDKLCFSVPWSQKSFEEEAENKLSVYFVARINDKIVGYGGVWKVQGEGQITNIAVHPEYRKNKIGSALLEKIIEECSDEFQIFLEVRESNFAAISLYKKYGFEKIGIRKNFYHSPEENGIIMTRRGN